MLDGKITLDDREVRDALAQARERLTNLRPLMTALAGRLHDAVEANFAAEGRPKWPELRPATIRQREKKGYWPGKLLQRRGQLARSIEPGANAERAWVGTNLRYAAIHQFGGTIQKRARTQVIAYDERARRFMSRRKARRRKAGSVGVRFAAIGAHTVTLPPRPYLTLTPGDREDLVAIVRRYLQGHDES